MKELTQTQIKNINATGWDDNIGNILSYTNDERLFIINTNIRAAFNALFEDKNTPIYFESINDLYKALKNKGLKCGLETFNRRINIYNVRNKPLYDMSNLVNMDIEQLKNFIKNIDVVNYNAPFVYEFYEMASMVLPEDFLLIDCNDKRSSASSVMWNSEKHKEQVEISIKEFWNIPGTRKKWGKRIKTQWQNPEYRKAALAARTKKTLDINKQIEDAFNKRLEIGFSQKLSRKQMSKEIAKMDADLSSSTVLNKICEGNRFIPELYKMVSPYIDVESLGNKKAHSQAVAAHEKSVEDIIMSHFLNSENIL
ncbi:MAG: hypothetical protein LBU68_02840 [Rickettsiales bacterium]|nr:hypothetical protein [Rickettsiales bacterium]